MLFQEQDYDYFGKMLLYDPRDKNAIYWSLNRIFDYSDDKVNVAIKEQIGVASRWLSPFLFPIAESIIRRVL